MQAKLDRYFNLPRQPRPHGTTLLDLPVKTRRLIFDYLDLIKEDHIHLNGSSLQKEPQIFIRGYRPPFQAHSLMLVCRTLYQEVCPIVYGQNQFFISRNAPCGLRALFNLGPLALASLLSIQISIHECQFVCKAFKCSQACDDCDDLSLSLGTRPLAHISPNSRSVITEWEMLCAHIAPYLKPSRLRLCVICDTDSCETAKKIVKPMQLFSSLGACAIRLSNNSVSGLRSLAAHTALSLTSKGAENPASYDLPYELKSEILQYTDLVAPHDLQWVPQQGYICRSGGIDSMRQCLQLRPDSLNPCELCALIHRHCYRGKAQNAALYSSCSCWRFPANYFLVSREVHQIATRIFYSNNHFNIFCYDNHSKEPTLHLAKFPPFTKRLTGNALPYLRSLQFMISDIPSFPSPQASVSIKNWTECVRMLKQDGDIPRLSITIDFSRAGEIVEVYDDHLAAFERDKRARVTEQRIIGSLKLLHGLKDLFVHWGYPRYRETYPRHSADEREKREIMLEQSVMGQDYNATARGKYVFKDRWWRQIEEVED